MFEDDMVSVIFPGYEKEKGSWGRKERERKRDCFLNISRPQLKFSTKEKDYCS